MSEEQNPSPDDLRHTADHLVGNALTNDDGENEYLPLGKIDNAAARLIEAANRIEELEAENRSLTESSGKLPTTKDNVPVFIGDTVYEEDGTPHFVDVSDDQPVYLCVWIGGGTWKDGQVEGPIAEPVSSFYGVKPENA